MNSAPGQRPNVADCDTQPHQWVPAAALHFAITLDAALPSGHTTDVFRDAEAEARRGTACRLDDSRGDPVGAVLITDGYAFRASLGSIAEQVPRAAEELRRLAQQRQSGTHFVLVDEHGVRVKER